MFLKHLQGWWLHQFPGQPIPAPDHSFREAVHPNVQPEFLLVHMWLYVCLCAKTDRNADEPTLLRPSESIPLTLELSVAQYGAFLILPQSCSIWSSAGLRGCQCGNQPSYRGASSSRNAWKKIPLNEQMRGRTTCEKGNETLGDREKCNETKQCGGEKQEDKAKKRL